MIQPRSEADALRKLFVTLTAGRAFVQIDIAGGRLQRDGEIPLLTLNTFHRGQGQQFDMLFPAALRQFRRERAQIAVIGREGPVQLGHQSTDGIGLIDQDDILFRLRQIQGRPYSSKTAADNKYLVMTLIFIHFHFNHFPFTDLTGSNDYSVHLFIGVILETYSPATSRIDGSLCSHPRVWIITP